MGKMRERDKALLKCLEALYSMVSVVAAVVGSQGYMSSQEGKSFERAHGRWNSAHTDLLREMRGDGDE